MATFVLMDGGASHGDGGACTHVTWQSAGHRQLEANVHEGRAGDRCIMLISKVSMCTILTTLCFLPKCTGDGSIPILDVAEPSAILHPLFCFLYPQYPVPDPEVPTLDALVPRCVPQESMR